MPVILATWNVEIRRNAVQASPGKKINETNKSCAWWHTPVILATPEALNTKIMVQVGPDINVRPCWKIPKEKKLEPHKVVHACNPNTQEVEAGGSPVPGQPDLHTDTLSKVNK
jgi:hypothetical protein